MFRILKLFLKYIVRVLLLLLLLDAVILFGIAKYRPELKKADAAIVLGAAINSPALQNRAQHALELYQQKKVSTIVTTGGRISEQDMSEAEYAYRYIQRRDGEVGSAILIEGNSRSTKENIINARAKLGLDKSSVVIVSDEFHLARGVLMAKAAGFQTVQWSAPSSRYYSNRELVYYYAREYAGLLRYIPIYFFEILGK